MQRVRAHVCNRMVTALFGGGIYGSFRDGTWLPVINKDGKYDVDVDALLHSGFLSEEDQKHYIRYIEETPGFVNIDLTDMEENKLKRSFTSEMNFIEKNGRKYLSALKSKKEVSEMSTLYETSDQRLASFKNIISPLEADARSASSEMVIEGGVSCNFNLHGDLVQCIACENWPLLAYSWCARARHWPDGRLVEEITNSVFHIVSKPSLCGDAEIEWRLSFSYAEYKLMNAITGPKLTTYMILKNLINESGNLRDNTVLKTYHLKTVFFWACEKQTTDFWNVEEIDKCVYSVLDSLIEGFSKSCIPHYFIPEINLLNDIFLKSLQVELQDTVEDLNKIKQGLQIKCRSPNHDIDAIAMMELASMKAQNSLCKKQLESKQTEPSNDMMFVGLSFIRECLPYISDYASIACHSAYMGFINEIQLQKIEATLSCCYAMLSVCAEQVESVVKTCKDKHQNIEELVNQLTVLKHQHPLVEELQTKYSDEPLLIETLLSELKDHDEIVNSSLIGTFKTVSDIEFPHGHYNQPYSAEFTYLAYAKFLVKLALAMAELTVNKKLEHMLNKIISSTGRDGPSFDILTEIMKPVIPDFKWSCEDHLSVHQLAQEDVWKLGIPIDILAKQKKTLSVQECQGKCWEKKLNTCKGILECDSNSASKISMYNVTFKGINAIYAEGQRLENLGMLKLLKRK